MNSKVSKQNLEILLKLKEQLETADMLFMEMSKWMVCLMLKSNRSRKVQGPLFKLDRKRREIIDGVVIALETIYPEMRLSSRSAASDHDLISYMIQSNAKTEELEKIIVSIIKQNEEIQTDNSHQNRKGRSLMKIHDFSEEFNRKFEKEQLLTKRPNILIVGYTGCGKTSIIRTVVGEEVPKEAVTHSKPCRIEFDRYENENICLWDSRGLKLGDSEHDFCQRMKDFIAERRDSLNVDEHIHLVWYLIQGNGARVTECDFELTKNIFTQDNVIVLISKNDITRPEQLQGISRLLIEAGIPKERILPVSDTEGGSINTKELVELSRRMLPAAYRDAFMSAQSIDREARAQVIAGFAEKAREMIKEAIAESESVPGKSCPPSNTSKSLNELTARLAALYGVRDRDQRNKAAQFVQDIASEFAGIVQETESETERRDAGVLVGALGHYIKNNFEAYALARVRAMPLPDLGFDFKQFIQFYQQYKQGKIMKPNILICGKTGVGKTSLIQAVTHRGIVPDSAIGNGKAATVGFQLYETEIANFIDSEGMNPGVQCVEEYADLILNEMLERLDSDEKSRLIHNIWYCIDGSGARVQEADAKLIKSFGDKVILVVTKSELMRKEQTEAMMKMLLALIGRERIVFVSAESKTGLCQLIARAETVSARSMAGAEAELEAFRDHWNDYYDKMKASWMQCVSSDADKYVNWAAGRAAAIALVPLPLADVCPLIANEVYMIYKLAGIYGIAVDNTVVTMLLGCAGGSLIGKIGASFLPFLKIPIAAAVTYGVGKTAKAYFESEMTLSPSELKEEFMAGEREARKREWKPISAE